MAKTQVSRTSNEDLGARRDVHQHFLLCDLSERNILSYAITNQNSPTWRSVLKEKLERGLVVGVVGVPKRVMAFISFAVSLMRLPDRKPDSNQPEM